MTHLLDTSAMLAHSHFAAVPTHLLQQEFLPAKLAFDVVA